jgi:hypothetical protein
MIAGAGRNTPSRYASAQAVRTGVAAAGNVLGRAAEIHALNEFFLVIVIKLGTKIRKLL